MDTLKIAEMVFALVDNIDYLFEDGLGYDRACDLLGLSEEEKVAVLEVIEENRYCA